MNFDDSQTLRAKVESTAEQATALLPKGNWCSVSIADNVMVRLGPSSSSLWVSFMKRWLARHREHPFMGHDGLRRIHDFDEHYSLAPLKRATLLSYFWALGVLFDSAGRTDSAERDLLHKIARRYSRNVQKPEPRSPALRRPDMERIWASINPNDPRQVRDAALFSVLRETMARPVDLLGTKLYGEWIVPPVQVCDFSRCRDGTGRIALIVNGESTQLQAPLLTGQIGLVQNGS